MEAHPNDLALQYAYARFLWGNSTADSKEMLEEVIAADPEFRGLTWHSRACIRAGS